MEQQENLPLTPDPRSPEPSRTEWLVRGFKAFAEEARISLRPVTVLCGANSSGKSSAMQSLLLLKQTIEATWDPGPLALGGDNVHFSSVQEIPTRGKRRDSGSGGFSVGLRQNGTTVRVSFWTVDPDVGIQSIEVEREGRVARFSEGDEVPPRDGKRLQRWLGGPVSSVRLERQGFWLVARARGESGGEADLGPPDQAIDTLIDFARGVTHVRGLRGNPQPEYPRTAVGPRFRGEFTPYTASVLLDWAEKADPRLAEIRDDLETMGLTWKVVPKRLDANRIELRVGRMPRPQRGGAGDLVGIAQVGFGVSQALPVLVALRAARKGTLVFVEQPEIHLHPRAQAALIHPIRDAAARGVIVVIETHSVHLLRALQGEIVAGSPRLPVGDIGLHWFQRDAETGNAVVRLADLDESGAWSDWPEDFSETEASLDYRWLDAVDGRSEP